MQRESSKKQARTEKLQNGISRQGKNDKNKSIPYYRNQSPSLI